MGKNKLCDIIIQYLLVISIIILSAAGHSTYSETCQKSSVPLYRYYNGNNGDHFYTINWNEVTGGKGDYKYEGVQCRIFPKSELGTSALHRYYNSGNGDHFYTTNWAELDSGGNGYVYEGIAGYVYQSQTAGTVALLRYYNRGNGDHFYTTIWDELGGGRDG